MSYTYSTGNISYASKTYTYTANIVSYDANTKIATLDAPVNVSLGYNSNLGDVTSQYNIIGNQQNISQAITNGGPVNLATDENGNFTGIFNIPAGVFQVGQKIFREIGRAHV